MGRVQRVVAVVVAASLCAGCGAGERTDVALHTTTAPGAAVPEPNPPGVPRFLEAAVAATGSHILVADNAIHADVRLYDRAGAPLRYVTPSRRVFRPDVAAVGERFVLVGAECDAFEVGPDQEPVCRPGGILVQVYEPAADEWSVVGEGLGEGEEQLVGDLVLADEAHAVIHLRWVGHGELVEVDLRSGERRTLPPPSEVLASDDQEHFAAACDVGGRLAVLVTRAELVGTAPVRVVTQAKGGEGWEEPVDLPIDDPGLAVDVPMCSGDGFVMANPSETLAFRGGRLTVTAPIPHWSGLSAPVRTADGFGVWMEGRLWILDESGSWRDSGLAAEHVLASVGVGDAVAVVLGAVGAAPTLSVLPLGP